MAKTAKTTKTTAKTTSKRSSAPKAPQVKTMKNEVDALGLPLKTWVETLRVAKGTDVRSGKRGFVIAIGHRDPKKLKGLMNGHLSKWQLDLLLNSDSESLLFHGQQGPVWVLRAPQLSNRQAAEKSTDSLEKSGFARFRDLAGAVVSQLGGFALDKLILEFHEMSLEEERGALIGMEMATYHYRENRGESGKPRKSLPNLLLRSASATLTAAEIRSCAQLALSVNLARHLTNIPGGELNPRTYSEAIDALFAESETAEVSIWQGERLAEERMNLLMAVGGGAAEGPRLVHIRYRPTNPVADVKPVAIVGKGITFDSGGLDIKPSSGMRWMKKDMGGSAATIALAYWAQATELPVPLDFYVALAENAVSGGSFRPGDVITARNGLAIEIHNTDAEGRLVLADALDVAVTQVGEDEPAAVINIATLTGAIKVGLGSEIAGLFTNSDDLAREITEAGRRRGDLSWRMPLFQPYKSMLRSTFGDYSNCSEGGFGGAITAALFLELFVKGKPWAHLDVYAWKDGASGAWAESGGNGQPVLALSEVLARLAAGNPVEGRQ